MADRRNAPRRFGLVPPSPTGEDQRATTFELLFDLVYVFAVTEVTSYMAHQESATAVLEGVLILALLWWTWSGYTWLGNQARADEGLMRWVIRVRWRRSSWSRSACPKCGATPAAV